MSMSMSLSLFATAESVLNLNFLGLFGKVLVIFCHSIRAATQVRAQQKDNKYFWLYSYVLVLLNSFGGGILAPIFLGQPSLLLSNNLLVPLSALAWYLTHQVPGMQAWFTSLPVKLGWGLGHCLFRVFSITAMVRRAHNVLTPDPYYHIPLVGPIVAGVMTGSLGMFLPPDKGIAAIQHRCPWPVQGALITATVYHLAVHDKEGALGGLLWWVLRWGWNVLRFGIGFLGLEAGAGGGGWCMAWSDHEQEVGVRVLLLVMWVTMQWGQTLRGPDFNIFKPFYNFLYTILKIENPHDVKATTTRAPVDEISNSKMTKTIVVTDSKPEPVTAVPQSPSAGSAVSPSLKTLATPPEPVHVEVVESSTTRRYSTRGASRRKKTQ